ncbi:protein FAM227A isoform X2 [Struthio camelus]|uniref:protein FAM227A isoform X2 n=1 Tax=Struthio camelus TaxID=8801 RepID=UPI0036040AF8
MATAGGGGGGSPGASRHDLLGLPPWQPEGAVREGLEDIPSECLVGTLTEVNQKIVYLEQEFERYHNANTALKHLEFSKRYSEQKSSRQEKKFPETCKDKDKGRREICGFMQKYGRPPQESDDDMPPQSTSEEGTVEMYQYPGYNKHKLTPLPNGIELTDVVEKTVRAQGKSSSGKTLFPREMLRNFLIAPVSQAILVDSFWWLFLHLYQPNQEIEEQLFDHIAKNYAFLLLDCHRFHHQEALIEVFPSLLSQALYICFCSGFPRSRFNTDEFKTQLCNVISEWIAGTLPVPRSYANWDYSQLEPERFKMNSLQSPKGKHRRNFKVSSSPEKTNRHCLLQRKEPRHGQASSKYQPHQTSKVIKSKQAKHKAVTLPVTSSLSWS